MFFGRFWQRVVKSTWSIIFPISNETVHDQRYWNENDTKGDYGVPER